MEISLLNNDPYGELICKYFASHFNKAIVPSSKHLLDILTTILIGDKNTRLGPTPDPEQLVVIRATISKAIELGEAIPILIAWGGRKTDASKGPDVAEVSAIYQIIRLDDNIKTYYKPGIRVHIRIEDLGADWIYRKEEGGINEKIDSYSGKFEVLTNFLAKDHLIDPIRESWLMNKKDYFELSVKYSDLIAQVIRHRVIAFTIGEGDNNVNTISM